MKSMQTINDIEEAVTRLSATELVEFRMWFEQFDADNWDKKIASENKSGKLADLANKALTDYKSGKFKEV